MSEITKAERQRWRALAKADKGYLLSVNVVVRLLDALEAAEAGAQK